MPNYAKPGERAALALIDRTLEAAKASAHTCQNETARTHHEFALALLRESWIAESGQKARDAATVIEDVRKGLRLIARLKELETQPALPLEV